MQGSCFDVIVYCVSCEHEQCLTEMPATWLYCDRENTDSEFERKPLINRKV